MTQPLAGTSGWGGLTQLSLALLRLAFGHPLLGKACKKVRVFLVAQSGVAGVILDPATCELDHFLSWITFASLVFLLQLNSWKWSVVGGGRGNTRDEISSITKAKKASFITLILR